MPEQWMNHIDHLCQQLIAITQSRELAYKVLEWLSKMSLLEIETIINDYKAQEAEAPRPSFYMGEIT